MPVGKTCFKSLIYRLTPTPIGFRSIRSSRAVATMFRAGMLTAFAATMHLGCRPTGSADDDTGTSTPAPSAAIDYTIDFETVDGNFGWRADQLQVRGKDLEATFSYYKGDEETAVLAEEEAETLYALLDAADFLAWPESTELAPGQDGEAALGTVFAAVRISLLARPRWAPTST